MDFAKKHLEKYGWTEGKGLGRNEDGISQALKPKLKFDNAGIGHQVGEQFTNNWWERVFNNAAKNINVKSEDNEMRLERVQEPIEIPTQSYTLKDLKKTKRSANIYGNFLKAAKCSNDEDLSITQPFNALTDDELFAACGGRTAHKGARHGLKLSGKLSRIEKQEKLLLKKMKNVCLSDDSSLEKKMKKIKKLKEENISQDTEMASTSSNKKKKKKRKSVSFSNETIIKYYVQEFDTSHELIREERPGVIDPNLNSFDEGIEQDIDPNVGEKIDNQISFEKSQAAFNDLSKAERKKLKKRRKMEKTATAIFIEEVREELSFDENGKKRKFEINTFSEPNAPINNISKKIKYVPEEFVRKENKRDRKVMKSIVKSLDNFCKISDEN